MFENAMKNCVMYWAEYSKRSWRRIDEWQK